MANQTMNNQDYKVKIIDCITAVFLMASIAFCAYLFYDYSIRKLEVESIYQFEQIEKLQPLDTIIIN